MRVIGPSPSINIQRGKVHSIQSMTSGTMNTNLNRLTIHTNYE